MRRAEKRGSRHFCSRQCVGRESPPAKAPPRNIEHLKRVANNRRDEFSPFRTHLARLLQRKHQVNVDLYYLKELWDEQKGTCPITGWKLHLPDTSEWTRVKATPHSASLDRIDNSQGYIVGNVRWIACMANVCRRSWSDEDVVEFAKSVVAYQP